VRRQKSPLHWKEAIQENTRPDRRKPEGSERDPETETRERTKRKQTREAGTIKDVHGDTELKIKKKWKQEQEEERKKMKKMKNA